MTSSMHGFAGRRSAARGLAAAALTWAVAAALLALPAAAQDGGEVIVEPSRQITTSTNPTRLFVNPQLAVHPDNPSTVVLAAGDARNGGCGLHVSRDAGLSWTRTVEQLLPEENPFCVQRNFGPYIEPVFASDGTLYVGLSGSSAETEPAHPNGPITGYVARTTDLGASHEIFVSATPDEVEASDGENTETVFEQWRLPRLAVDPNDPDKLYMGWRLWFTTNEVSFSVMPQRAYLVTSDDGGETWTEPVDAIAEGLTDEEVADLGLVLESTEGEAQTHADTPFLVVDSEGTAYGFVKERPFRGAEPGNARIYMLRSTDGGATWDADVINEGAPNLDNPAVAIDRSTDQLHLVYAARGAERENPSQVFYQTSTDGGDTWTDPVVIGDAGEASGFNRYFPGVSVAPNGRVDVAWHDFRNDPFFTPGESGAMGTAEGERWWDVYYTSSSDGGQTWTPDVRVTDRSIDGERGVTFNNNDIRGPIGLGSTDSMVYVAWADTRAGTETFDVEDAYFTRLRLSPEAVPGAAAAPAASTSDRVLFTIIGATAALALGGLVLLLGTRGARRAARQPAAAKAETKR